MAQSSEKQRFSPEKVLTPEYEAIGMGGLSAGCLHLWNPKNANLVMMGAYVELTKTITPDLVEADIERSLQLKGLSQSKVADGKQAFAKGISLASGHMR